MADLMDDEIILLAQEKVGEVADSCFLFFEKGAKGVSLGIRAYADPVVGRDGFKPTKYLCDIDWEEMRKVVSVGRIATAGREFMIRNTVPLSRALNWEPKKKQ